MKQVIFRIPVAQFNGTIRYLQLFRDIFGLPEAVDYRELKNFPNTRKSNNEFDAFIVCPAEKFSEFIIARNRLNIGQNLIRCLDAQIFDPEDPHSSAKAWEKVDACSKHVFVHYTD